MFGKGQTLKQTSKVNPISEDSGLIARLIKTIFEKKAAASRLNFSMFQIYNENVFDSLERGEVPLQVLEDNGGHSCVQGLSSIEISSEEDAFLLLAKGNKNRFVRETEYNAWSSRSHTVVMIEYDEFSKNGPAKVVWSDS